MGLMAVLELAEQVGRMAITVLVQVLAALLEVPVAAREAALVQEVFIVAAEVEVEVLVM